MIYKGKIRKLIMSDGSEYVGYGFGEDTLPWHILL